MSARQTHTRAAMSKFLIIFMLIHLPQEIASDVTTEQPPLGNSSHSQVISVLWDAETGDYDIKKGTFPSWVVWANFSNEIMENGWSFLNIVTNETYPDGVQAYAAGLAEGYLTSDLLENHWMNMLDDYCDDDDDLSFCDNVWNFLQKNMEWMKTKINITSDPYWHQMDLMLKQLQGLQDGCQVDFIDDDSHKLLKDFGFLLFSAMTDADDLRSVFNHKESRPKKPGSCSALIKLLPGNSDLLVSHVTWDDYSGMTRCIKRYEFHYHTTDNPGSPVIPGHSMAFSSYPGALHSTDDFYIISNSDLVIMETSLDVFNEDLWKHVHHDNVLEFFRVMYANRVALDGKSWTATFVNHNSGTYNNQWMIVDFKEFHPAQTKLGKGLLWVVEQLPGFAESADMSHVLQQQTFWASYNTPYFTAIDELSGAKNMTSMFGDFYSKDNNPRAKIFRRDHHQVVDVDSIIKLMRSNNYQTDPLSICKCEPPHNAMNAIAARGDLNPPNGTYEFDDLEEMAFGATDMKLTNVNMMKSLQFLAYSGPTHENQTPFQWSKYAGADNNSHVGQPDLWNFSTVLTVWT